MTAAAFESRVRAWCRREGLLPRGAAAVVAASGGPDSTALLHVLASLAPAENWRLAVAHLDHALRPDSAADAAFVRAQAAALGLPFYCARVEVRALPASRRRSPEEAARLARRSFLARAAARFGADAVALGQTADDQAETVLLNLMRGAGTLGAAAMPPAVGLFVRPLLPLWRDDVLAYLNALGAAWRDDPTNRDPRYTRNWVRLELLPALTARFPRLKESLVALAAAARAEECALEAQTAELLEPLVEAGGGGEFRLAGAFAAAFPEALRGRAVRQLYRCLTGSFTGLERRHVEAVLALGVGGAVSLPANARAARDAAGWVFRRAFVAPELRAWSAVVPTPGVVTLPPLGIEISAASARAPAVMAGRGLDEVWLDEAVAGRGVVVRRWRGGDALAPVGLGGRKKLQDLFTDAKVPAAARRLWPVVTAGDGVIWVPGLALAEGVAARPAAPSIFLKCSRRGGPLANGDDARRSHELQGKNI